MYWVRTPPLAPSVSTSTSLFFFLKEQHTYSPNSPYSGFPPSTTIAFPSSATANTSFPSTPENDRNNPLQVHDYAHKVATPPPSFLQSSPPPLFQSFSRTLLFPDHGRCCCRSSPLPIYLHRKASHPSRQPTHLNLSLDPPATDILHVSPASGTSTFLSLSSLHSHQPLPLGSLLRP